MESGASAADTLNDMQDAYPSLLQPSDDTPLAAAAALDVLTQERERADGESQRCSMGYLRVSSAALTVCVVAGMPLAIL